MSDPESNAGVPDASPPSEAAAATATATAPPPEEAKRRSGSPHRRHLVWGLIVVLVGAAVGATVGWSSQVPIYESTGIVLVEPSMRSLEDPTGSQMLPMFDAFIRFQVELMQQRRTALLAMETGVWKEEGEGWNPKAVERFESRRHVDHAPGAQHLVVSFRDADPQVAVAGVNALLQAYLHLARELGSAEDADLLQAAQRRLDALQAHLHARTEQIIQLTQDFGGVEGIEMRHRAVVEQLIAAEEEFARLKEEVRRRETQPEADPEEIAVESAQMAELLLELAERRAEDEAVASKVPEDDELRRKLRSQIVALEERVEAFAAAWNRSRAGQQGRSTRDDLEATASALTQRMASLRDQARRLGTILEDVARLQAETDRDVVKLEQLKTVRDRLEARLSGSGRISVASRGSFPLEPARDDRTLYAWIGGLVGGLGALLLFLLASAVTRRIGRAGDVEAYHARVRAATSLLPKRIGEWKGHDVALPPAAARLGRPNLVVGREFQNPSTGEHATLRIVQCRDARDLSAYYPPIQYPADGWTLREAEPRHLPALLAAIPGTVYRFTKESADGASEVLVYNFFARPDGSIESGPVGALGAETHTQALGAAQFQILLGPTMTRDRRDEVFRTLIAAALPVMDALCVEDEED